MKKLLSFFIYSIIILSNISYSHSIEPDVFIQSTVNRAAETLSGNYSKEQRIEKLKDIAVDTVDIKGIGFLLTRLSSKRFKQRSTSKLYRGFLKNIF